MNQQQLQIARAALWHQNASPLMTYDDAAPWMDETGFCLFLPRHAQLPAPAPSLVEACMGEASATPPATAIAAATELAVRMMDARRVVPLNLLGTFSEQPDFLVTPEALSWVVAVRGDRNWKSAPGGRTSPLVVRVWEALEKQGGQTAIELRELLGREVTEAAVLRALVELWSGLRVIPMYTAGEPTRWQLLKTRFSAELAAGANTSQATALSALISMYLRSAVAATGEEAEIFLSPLTARSKIREVVHGMTATRSLGTTTVATQTMLFVEGSLPEMPEVAEETAEKAPPRETAPERERRPKPFAARGPERTGQRSGPRPGPRREERERPPERERRPARPGQRPAFGQRSGGQRAGGAGAGEKRPWKPREEGRPDRFAAKRGEAGPERPRRARPDGERPRSEGRPGFRRGGEAAPGGRSFRPERGGQDKPWKAKPWQKREEGRPLGRRPEGSGAGRPGTGPAGAQRPGFERPGFERPGRAEGGERPRGEFRPRREGAFRREEGERPRRQDAPGQGRTGFRREGAGAAGARPPRTGAAGERREREFGGRPGAERGGRPGFKGGAARPGGPGKPAWKKPRTEEGGNPERGGVERPSGPGAGRPSRPGGRTFGRTGGARTGGGRTGSKPGFRKAGPGRPGPGRPGSGRAGFGKGGAPKPRPGRGERKPGGQRRQEENPE